MKLRTIRPVAVLSVAVICMWAGLATARVFAQYSDSATTQGQSSSSSSHSGAPPPPPPSSKNDDQARTPSLVNPAGPTISLISSEPVFYMAAALNACGYNEGLNESDPIRKWVRGQMNQALAASVKARSARDKMCLFIAQHNLTGTDEDQAQYISLALYLTQPPTLKLTVAKKELPPDATEVLGILPLVKRFAAAIDLNGIWLVARRTYDHDVDLLHGPISQMIVKTDTYLHMPAQAYNGRRFIVVLEPMLSPHMVNARIYGLDYVVVVSPVNGKIPMDNVRHTYLHYVIDPLLFSRTNNLKQLQPILNAVQSAPLAYQFRDNTTLFTVECLIKAIEARTMKTGIPVYRIPKGINRSQLPPYEHKLALYRKAVKAAKKAQVAHDMAQGFVLTRYFYNQLIQFEKTKTSFSNVIGEMVFGMDVNQEIHIARTTQFDKVADQTELQRQEPMKLSGVNLAEERLAAGDPAGASAIANKVIAEDANKPGSANTVAHAYFVLARVALMTGHPQEAFTDFHKTLEGSKEPRIVAWSHIFLGRMLDLECKRSQAIAQYKAAMVHRDGRLDTLHAAEQGEKQPYTVNGHGCQVNADSGKPMPQAQAKPSTDTPANVQDAPPKPQ